MNKLKIIDKINIFIILLFKVLTRISHIQDYILIFTFKTFRGKEFVLKKYNDSKVFF